MTEQDKALFKEVNQLFDDWDKYGVAPNGIRQARNQLEQFYDWAGKDPKQNDKFNTHMKFNADQINEMRDIATSVLDSDLNFDPDALYKKYQKAHGKHGIMSFEDYVDFLDGKEIYSKEKVISSSMSYYEYEKLLQRATSKKVSRETLDKMITKQYLENGLKGEDLYEFIYEHLRPKNK